MTKLERLERAKKQTLKRWEYFLDRAFLIERRRGHLTRKHKTCGFCDYYSPDHNLLSCGGCPINKIELQTCGDVGFMAHTESFTYCLAVLIYIHGF